ncbi:MAG: hypothetical protein LAT65_09330 [Saccharospirillum sp.]|nr:hypothetical protein [Saccharospirillum sp.]
MLQATMPVAVLSYLLASHYEGPKDDIAAVILVSTPLSLFAILGIQAIFAYLNTSRRPEAWSLHSRLQIIHQWSIALLA